MKWYLKTWFICLMFALWMFVIPFFVGFILLYKQKKALEQSIAREYVLAKDEIKSGKDIEISKLDTVKTNLENEISRMDKLKSDLKKEIDTLNAEIKPLEAQAVIASYDFSDYDGITSQECKNKLSLLKQSEQQCVKSGEAYFIYPNNVSKKSINDNIKQILRCFNSECDNMLINLSVKNIDVSRNKITKSFETLNRLFRVDYVEITQKLLEIKLEELNLVYTFELKKEQEREQQRAIKEQMIEEEKVRREIERQKAKLDKDQSQCNNEIKRLMGYMQKTDNDIEKQLYIDKIKELETKLTELEEEKNTVLEREANARAGFVYVISNIGSFGENIYKIGMTRRLEPMDRIKELSSASVPFEFDVHAMIFSDDAPGLETMLHTTFKDKQINKVNPRKEFFKINLEDIKKVVLENHNATVTFTEYAKAEQYRQSLILSSDSNKI